MAKHFTINQTFHEREKGPRRHRDLTALVELEPAVQVAGRKSKSHLSR
jgi:hypothetical protein